MKRTCLCRGYAGRCRAFTLVELLVSLSLSAMLMAAIAAAFQASGQAIQTNDAYFRSTQSARFALGQIVTELRRADAARVESNRLQIIRAPDQRTPDEIFREYTYDATARRVTLQIFHPDRASSPIYELATDVTACTFSQARAGNDSPVAMTGPISLSLTCAIGGRPFTLNQSVTPRRGISAGR